MIRPTMTPATKTIALLAAMYLAAWALVWVIDAGARIDHGHIRPAQHGDIRPFPTPTTR